MTDRDLHDLAAAYALDALDGDERAAFEAHYPSCETCAAELAEFHETAALLTTDSQAPPEHLRAAIVTAIGQTPQVSPADRAAPVDLGDSRHRRHRTASGDEARPSRRRFGAARLLQAAAVVVVFAAGLLIGTSRTSDEPGGSRDVEYAGTIGTGTEPVGRLSVVATGIGRVINLDSDEFPILPTGEYYELWFVAHDDTATDPNRISAGTFHPDPGGNVNVQFAAAVDPSLYPIVEITAEPGDGNPAATGPVIAQTTIDP